MSKLLTETEIQAQASQLSGWKVEDNQLQCTRKFKDFIAAIDFVNRLVEPAEAANHHPDLEISYNRIKIKLMTHDAGGLTAKDFALAQQISQIS